MKLGGNEYTFREAAGAFGDLGTLVPFVVGYITINRLDAQSVLLGFGLVGVVSGLYFRTPMPVQPMKAIATTAITHAGTVTPGMLWASVLTTAIFWLVMGITGAVSWLAALTARPVVRGIVLGLGLSFILEGVTLMRGGPVLAVAGVVLTFLLLGQSRLPAIFALVAYGAGSAMLLDPTLARDLGSLSPVFRLPTPGPPAVTWTDLVQGTLVLAIPQAALTLGNAVIATAEEHNALFPARRVSVRLLALDHGFINLAAGRSRRGADVPRSGRDGRPRAVRGAHRGRPRHSRHPLANRRALSGRLDRHASAPVPDARPRRDPLLRRPRACVVGRQ